MWRSVSFSMWRSVAASDRVGAGEWKDERVSSDERVAPERIAHYRVECELGRGGQGRVFLAHDERLERKVALKVLPDRGPFSTRQLARFRREAEVAARLDHPGICTVYEAGEIQGMPYIAMRYVAGETMAAHIARARERSNSGKKRTSPGQSAA